MNLLKLLTLVFVRTCVQITSHLRKMCRNKEEAHCSEDRALYQQARNKLTQEIRTSKRSFPGPPPVGFPGKVRQMMQSAWDYTSSCNTSTTQIRTPGSCLWTSAWPSAPSTPTSSTRSSSNFLATCQIKMILLTARSPGTVAAEQAHIITPLPSCLSSLYACLCCSAMFGPTSPRWSHLSRRHCPRSLVCHSDAALLT
ncbi:hypothetical protein AMECASPLE_024864 [Ameca splendens]|uniref:Uncharacterized protein n=1 Tax=Ameca splendens TaxID=208324 RepID=A0ABV0XTE6_9TELE